MSWAYEFSKDAEKDLRGLPKPIQKRVARALTQMESNPFQGEVKSLQGDEWKGIFRRRIGDYRILFMADHERKVIQVLRILVRSGKTYQ